LPLDDIPVAVGETGFPLSRIGRAEAIEEKERQFEQSFVDQVASGLASGVYRSDSDEPLREIARKELKVIVEEYGFGDEVKGEDEVRRMDSELRNAGVEDAIDRTANTSFQPNLWEL